MTFRLPENMATRPITILGAGTLGRRIALMLATRGAEVRLYARSAATRDAGVAFAREQLPAVLAKLPRSKAGTIVGVGDMAAALKDAWIIVESVPEDLELKKTSSSTSMRSPNPTPSWQATPRPIRRAPLPTV
jgi:3-hydroxybutyryl-CoA dehydrogenase